MDGNKLAIIDCIEAIGDSFEWYGECDAHLRGRNGNRKNSLFQKKEKRVSRVQHK